MKLMTKPIYFDNNATTRVAPEVVEAMLPYFSDSYGNPSSMHSFGGAVGVAVKNAREQVANLIGADPEEILFTSCGSESDNTAIMSALQSQPQKKHIITTRVEHPAILNLVQYLEQNGYEATYLGVDEKGRVDLDEYAAALRKDTAIVSIMFANNEVGNIYPIQQMAEMAKEKDIVFHTDAVQAVGKVSINLRTLPADYLALSGHKLHAPKGIGVLYIRRGTRFRPILRGGHQERGRRAGTENVPYIIGLGKACELAMQNHEKDNKEMLRLRNMLENSLIESIPQSRINGDVQNRLPNTSSIAFKNIEGEAILLMLNRFGVCASSGSACTSGSLEPSHVLRAMGIPFNYAHSSTRFSLSRYTTEEDVKVVIKELPPIVAKLREMSPFKD